MICQLRLPEIRIGSRFCQDLKKTAAQAFAAFKLFSLVLSEYCPRVPQSRNLARRHTGSFARHGASRGVLDPWSVFELCSVSRAQGTASREASQRIVLARAFAWAIVAGLIVKALLQGCLTTICPLQLPWLLIRLVASMSQETLFSLIGSCQSEMT